MSEENKTVVGRVVEEIWNKGNLAVLDEVVAPGYVGHDPSSPEPIRGPEGFKKWVTTFRTAFPDMKYTTEDTIAEGDKVVLRWTGRGTHKGELAGIAPTGKPVTVTGISIRRVAGGKYTEGWDQFDALGVMQQLGVIPPPK